MENLRAYDTNKNGFIDNKEITKESKEAVLKASKKRHPKYAPIVLTIHFVIISIVIYSIIFLFNFIKKFLPSQEVV